MKQVTLLLMLFTVVVATAQTNWTFEMTQNATKNVKGILEYTASDGSVWTVGERLMLGSASGNKFVFVTMGDGVMSPVQPAGAAWGGTEAEIKKIRFSGTKRYGRYMWVTCKGPLQPINIRIEKAIQVGEVVTEGYTSDQALEELKRAKDKLDLGLITQEEFNALRTELSKYID